MDHELHAAGLVEEALEQDGVECRQGTERRARPAARYSTIWKAASGERSTVSVNQSTAAPGCVPESLLDLLAQARDGLRKLVAAPGRLAEPERNRGRLTVRILDAHRAALDPQDSIGGVAQLEHVALQALDGEVLVHRADELRLGLEHDAVVGVVRNRAARSDRREAAAAPRTQHLVDGVAMNERALPSAARAEPLGQHRDTLVESTRARSR